MKKLLIILISTILLTLLASCSDEEESKKKEVTAEDRLTEYINHWQNLEFENMYEMITAESQDSYPTEEYIDRYKKIYEDLEVENLSIEYTEIKPETSEENTQDEAEAATNEEQTQPEEEKFNLTVSMDTMAGPVSFEYETILKKLPIQEEETNANEETEPEKAWFVQWDPGFIFPQLKDGGKIRIETLTPARGELLDRNGLGLAINDVIYEIGVVPGQMGDETQKKEIIQSLSETLSISEASIEKALNQSWVQPDYFVPISKVSPSNEELLTKLFEIPSVRKMDARGRTYPMSEVGAHLIGYTGAITAEEMEKLEGQGYSSSDTIGKRGLEQVFEDRLKGEEGLRIYVEKENGSKETIAEKEVKHGERIKLTIDSEIQRNLYESMEGRAGSAVAMDPQTGEVLALVSSPSFDPNAFSLGINQDQYNQLQEDPLLPLVNRFSLTYTPGSVIKPIISAIGLEAGTIDPNDAIDINGLTWTKDGWGNYEVTRVSESSGPVDLNDALVRSDNIYFAQQGLKMGSETMQDGLEEFGFTEEFPFEYPIKSSSYSNSDSINGEVQLADSAYGQGQMQMSTIHLATAYTAFLNNQGNMIQPTLIQDSESTPKVWKEGLLSNENRQIIADALVDVVQSAKGTAPEAKISGWNLAGKTGTAELKSTKDEENAKTNGWFVAYPSDTKDLIVAMMIEGVQDDGGSHYTVKRVVEFFEKQK